MKSELGFFLLKWALFCVVLFGIHSYLFSSFFGEKELYFELWVIYLFNGLLVLLVYLIVIFQVWRGHKKSYNIFMVLTIVKMILAIAFLSPLVAGKSPDAITETLNFFIPYFLLLIFEIFQLSKFLKTR